MQKRKEKLANSVNKTNFPALELLNDPQRFGEDMYENLSKHGKWCHLGFRLMKLISLSSTHVDKQYSLDHKVLIMQLLSRVMGVHKLHILEFYGYIYK